MPYTQKINPNLINGLSHEFENCCGIREVGLDRLFLNLDCFNLRKLKSQLTSLVPALERQITGGHGGNVLVFTSSVMENIPQHIMIIQQLASVNVDLGPNPITGNAIAMHIVYVNQLREKIKNLKFV